MKKKQQIDNRTFSKPVKGLDPITKGRFTIDWAFVIHGWASDFDDYDGEATLGAVGQLTIDGNDTNPFYDVLIKTPLLIQAHPLSVDFGNDIRFIKITNVGEWEWSETAPVITLRNARFDFLDNLNYLESITDYKDNNLL